MNHFVRDHFDQTNHQFDQNIIRSSVIRPNVKPQYTIKELSTSDLNEKKYDEVFELNSLKPRPNLTIFYLQIFVLS